MPLPLGSAPSMRRLAPPLPVRSPHSTRAPARAAGDHRKMITRDSPVPPSSSATPLHRDGFDLLYQGRRDLTGRPLRDRRARLEDAVAGSELVFAVRRLARDGLEAWRQVVERGYEGYVEGRGRRVRGRGHEVLAQGEAVGWTDADNGWRLRIGASGA
jgi:hypothetical protein